jgi:uncharacterized membrane protein
VTALLVVLLVMGYMLVGMLAGAGVAYLIDAREEENVLVYLAAIAWPVVVPVALLVLLVMLPGAAAGALYRKYNW